MIRKLDDLIGRKFTLKHLVDYPEKWVDEIIGVGFKYELFGAVKKQEYWESPVPYVVGKRNNYTYELSEIVIQNN